MKFQADKFLKVLSSLIPESRSSAGAVNGTAADTLGFQEALIVLHEGTHGAGATNAVKVQDSADNSTFADLPSATFGTITDAQDETVYVGSIDLRQSTVNRYIRVVATDAVGAVLCGAEIVLLASYALPVSQSETVAFRV